MNPDFGNSEEVYNLTYGRWFYPYFYSPMISDLINFVKLNFSFNLNNPFKPFDKITDVLPELSCESNIFLAQIHSHKGARIHIN
ncbi:hypothetical protein VP01_979g3 [Puccinia sorghi]|uniref:Xrn1 helical domain-containing protein n=1 Tax=Puccinia sorghi TaxID=27349 RepID=A0A0L6U5S2_9BASI|nr:hypothetical protein VP01_979g3 [Puccinia sorghi]